ncbi:MAG: hypothetical protein HZB41_01060 [Ignavibacteriae bacterium]|nr:hypothetical protein [Ignavibacteriota bacterium]
METLNNNSMSDLIYLFLDGEADSTQQQVLFRSLAENPDLQSEFQEAVTLNKSLSADSKDLIPSNELTHNLFVKAGFESGAAGSTASGILSESSRNTFLSGMSGKIKSSFIPASVGSIITAALLTTGMYLLDIDFHSERHAAVNQGGAQKQLVTQTESQVPVIKSEAVQEVNRGNKFSNVYRRRAVPVFLNNSNTIPKNKENISENNIETEINDPVIIIPDIQESEIVQLFENPELKYRTNNFTQLSVPARTGFGDLSVSSKIGLLVEVKGINNLGFFDNRKIDESKLFLKNLSMNILYKFSDKFYLGASAGNDNLQVYEVSEDSSGIYFKAEPNLFWAGVSLKTLYDNIEFLGNLQPYVDLTAALSKWGPVLKGAVGMYYNPENTYTMGLGLECTGIYLWNTPGSTIGTGKYSLVYSFGYNF